MHVIPSPVPTPGPSVDVLYELLRRQASSDPVCGFSDGSFFQTFTCIEDGQCVTNLDRSAWGCCPTTSSNCHIPTSCIDFSDLQGCDRSCQANPDIMPCTDQNFQFCFTDYLDIGGGTVLSNANCANGELFGGSYLTTWTESASFTGAAPIVKYASVTDNYHASSSVPSVFKSKPTAASSPTAGLATQTAGQSAGQTAGQTQGTTSAAPTASAVAQGLSSGVVAAIVVPIVIVVLLLIAAGIFLIYYMKKKRRQRTNNTDMWSPINAQRLQQLRSDSRTSEELARSRYLSGGFGGHEKPAPAPTVAGTIDDYVPHGG